MIANQIERNLINHEFSNQWGTLSELIFLINTR